MNIITSLTSYPNQRHQLVLENRESADFHLYYHGRTMSWNYDIAYNDLVINGCKVVLTPNALRQFKNIIPFGLMFFSDGDVEPFRLDDFSSGRIKMAVLNKEEVRQIEQEIFNRDL